MRESIQDLADRARSGESESEARFNRVRDLAIASRDAEKAHAAFFPEPKHVDEEAQIRWRVKQLRACRASIAAQEAYHKAADELFLAGESAVQDLVTLVREAGL